MNAEYLSFGQSYWDYLPDLVQRKILKLAYKALLERVHEELLALFYCDLCGSEGYECECKHCVCDSGVPGRQRSMGCYSACDCEDALDDFACCPICPMYCYTCLLEVKH